MRSETSSLRSSEIPLLKDKIQQWNLARETLRGSSRSHEIPEVDGSSINTEVELDELRWDEELRQPLSRKVPISSSKINPYRATVLIRLVALAFFFKYRLANPVPNAYGLWLTSVICEAWFTLSWILDQLCKWNPINRETYPDRLCLRYNYPGKECQLAPVDVFVTTMDPHREPPLVTANTVLSVLAVDYPVGKLTCYVSDDGASLLTLETLSVTCQFARKWVPFCKKYNIEPRSPESYFSEKVDCLRYIAFVSFVKERRAIKREYEEFKVQINSLIAKFNKTPLDGWIMKDGTPWPGNNTHNHPAMIQILLGRNGPLNSENEELPQVVYISREKTPSYQHNKMAGALNSLLRVSAILTNGAYILNLKCNQYINNSKALSEAMCFMMDPRITNKTCYVQFPRRFDGTDSCDRYANYNSVFYDITLKGLDGIQGPFYVGTGCCFNRKALYGYRPSKERKSGRLSMLKLGKNNLNTRHNYSDHISKHDVNYNIEPRNLERENPALFMNLKKLFGGSLTLVASTIVEDNRLSRSAPPEELLKAAIHVISSDYEDGTAWGREIGWAYGFLASDVLTGLKMHGIGWRSIYCMPSYPPLKENAPSSLSDCLHQVLRSGLGSVEMFFSGYCPLWYGKHVSFLERVAYVNTVICPLASIPLVIYCVIPAVCLVTGKFIFPPISLVGSCWLLVLLLSIIASGIFEMKWSGLGTQEWWRNQQFTVIGGVSANLFAVIYGTINIMVGRRADLTVLTDKSAEADIPGLYAFRWTSLLIMPTSIIIINLWAVVSGLSSASSGGYSSWGPLFAKLFFSFWVIIHLYPFLKGLLVRQNRIPTVVVVWSLILASLFSILWVRVNPFGARVQGPNAEDCGIYC